MVGIEELRRFNALTGMPLSCSCLTNSEPKKPVAPVTKIIRQKLNLLSKVTELNGYLERICL
jgi:hypothetical protein